MREWLRDHAQPITTEWVMCMCCNKAMCAVSNLCQVSFSFFGRNAFLSNTFSLTNTGWESVHHGGLILTHAVVKQISFYCYCYECHHPEELKEDNSKPSFLHGISCGLLHEIEWMAIEYTYMQISLQNKERRTDKAGVLSPVNMWTTDAMWVAGSLQFRALQFQSRVCHPQRSCQQNVYKSCYINTHTHTHISVTMSFVQQVCNCGTICHQTSNNLSIANSDVEYNIFIWAVRPQHSTSYV